MFQSAEKCNPNHMTFGIQIVTFGLQQTFAYFIDISSSSNIRPFWLFK
jgi:hypothetical protein